MKIKKLILNAAEKMKNKAFLLFFLFVLYSHLYCTLSPHKPPRLKMADFVCHQKEGALGPNKCCRCIEVKFPFSCPENIPVGIQATAIPSPFSSQAHFVYQHTVHIPGKCFTAQGVIWLASSGVTSRELSSENSAGSQYCDSPVA